MHVGARRNKKYLFVLKTIQHIITAQSVNPFAFIEMCELLKLSNGSMSDIVDVHSRNVVFYGSGETNNQRRKTNNPLYRKLLEQNWLMYSKVPNNKKLKESYVWNNIIQPIMKDGGRFYNSSGMIIDEYAEESRKVLLTKVSQALRDYKKKAAGNCKTTPLKQKKMSLPLKRKTVDDLGEFCKSTDFV
jgi:hypothetical protein